MSWPKVAIKKSNVHIYVTISINYILIVVVVLPTQLYSAQNKAKKKISVPSMTHEDILSPVVCCIPLWCHTFT